MTTDFIASFEKRVSSLHEHNTADDFALREIVPLSYLIEKNSKWVLQIDLPGVERKNIVLTITHGHVVVKAKLEEAFKVSNHGQVIKFENMKKAVELPPYADIKKISAKFKNGILTITIPKIDSGKRIPIK
ncbi:MAG: Hsp20/alpha crystallin family protein [Thaumarchaeota archaeon]|nr:Hsp20/alpha crystallin family protein [Nitrososphaerota archaeon]